MPTPVSAARQCLTNEAAQALDEAVAVARRRSHAQTTSLHVVSALLSLPSSTLREACARARNCAYAPRLQFKALELCLSVSLDRVSTSPRTDDPPVSNSLMAAIKRSQANQRRQPENFHLYHHQLSQSPSSSATVIKVELEHLILSILDDPVVSRVFSEAGFRSSEIKLAIVRPMASQLFKFSRSKVPPPIFLCNYLNESFDPGPGRRRLNSSFPGFGGFLDCDMDENCRRISGVLAVQRKNPLLVGVYANTALKSFYEYIEKKNINDNNNSNNSNNNGLGLAMELSGLSIISIENEVSRFVNGSSDKECVNEKFEEVSLSIERSLGPGVVVNYGDLKEFVNENNNNNNNNNNDNNNNNNNNNNDDDDSSSNKNNEAGDAVSHVVAQLTRLLQLHGGKVWLIGAAATYETYLKFVSRFASIEKDWELQILPITSLNPPSMDEARCKSSLMGSFVPLGGFFSTPSDFKSPLSSLYQSASRCHQCNEKCEQEISAHLKGGFADSIADQYQSVLPSWLQMAEPGIKQGLDLKTKDGGLAPRSKITKKWDDICQRLHQTQSFPSSNINPVGSHFPALVGLQFPQHKKETSGNRSSNTNAPPNENSCINGNSSIPTDLDNMSASESDLPFHMASKTKNESLLLKLREKPSKANLEPGGHMSPHNLSNSSVDDGRRASPTSVTSVTTNLGLAIGFAPTSNELKAYIHKDRAELSQELSVCCSANVDLVNRSISNHPAQFSSSSCPDLKQQLGLIDRKSLFRALTERIGWQDKAIVVISQTIAQYKTGNGNHLGTSPRGDAWFNFTGPDRCGKRKTAIALAEIIYGCKESFISVDLCPLDRVKTKYTTFDHRDASGDNAQFRGKNVVDYVFWELRKKPLSIVFLENIDKADFQVHNSLSKAVQTGKFSDSYGREVSISNAIFVTTSSFVKDTRILDSKIKHSNYSEERILRAKCWLMQIVIEPALGNDSISQKLSTSVTREGISSPTFVNKRKLTGGNENPRQDGISEMVKRAHRLSTKNLDLNLPAEEDVVQDIDDEKNSENDSSESSKSWVQDFFEMVETVVFEPFNFDALAEKILKDIKASFHKTVGSECLLEIDPKVMEQILAAAYLSDKDSVVEEWLEKVLSRGFLELQEKYKPSANSVVKLVSCEGHFQEDPKPGVWLPSKIILN